MSLADGPESNNLEPPVSEYSTVFLNRPQEAATILGELYRNGDTLVPFLRAACEATPTTEGITTMSDTGFSMLLAHVLVSDRRYSILSDLALPENTRSASYYELLYSIALLNRFGLHWKLHISIDAPSPVFGALCDSLSPMWELLWRHRKAILRSDANSAQDKAFRYQTANLLRDYVIFHRTARNGVQAQLPISSYTANVAYYLWYHVPGDPEWTCLVNCVTQLVQHESAPPATFFAQVVPATARSEDLIDFIWSALTHDSTLHGNDLADVLNLITWTLTSFRSPLQTPSIRNADILLGVATASQRHACVGDACFGDVGEDRVFRATLLFISAVYARNRGLFYENFAKNLPHANFLPVIAQTIVWSCTRNDVSTKDAIRILVEALIASTRSGSRSPAHQTSLQRTLRIYWLPALDGLCNARRSLDAATRANRNAVDSFNEGITLWRELGDAFGLDERGERLRLAQGDPEDDLPYSLKVLGCFSTDCPCYGHKSLHGKRRVCKGCWQAQYCGQRCQKRDWTKGHRETCRRLERSVATHG